MRGSEENGQLYACSQANLYNCREQNSLSELQVDGLQQQQ